MPCSTRLPRTKAVRDRSTRSHCYQELGNQENIPWPPVIIVGINPRSRPYSLHTFLNPPICYDCSPCSASSRCGSDYWLVAFVRIAPCSWRTWRSPATHRAETPASQAQAQPPGPTVLGLRSAILVRLEKFSHHRHPGDRGPLAPCRLPQVLESDLQGERASRKEEAVPGDPGSHLPNGER